MTEFLVLLLLCTLLGGGFSDLLDRLSSTTAEPDSDAYADIAAVQAKLAAVRRRHTHIHIYVGLYIIYQCILFILHVVAINVVRSSLFLSFCPCMQSPVVWSFEGCHIYIIYHAVLTYLVLLLVALLVAVGVGRD